MDSGNSGSLQSSSGGDEEYEYDSTAFLNNSTSSSTHVGALSNSHQLLPPSSSSSQHHHHHYHHQHQNPNHPTSLFDPLSNYFDVFSSSTPPTPAPISNSPLNLGMVWSRSEPSLLRSDQQNYTDHHVGALIRTSSSSQSIMGSAHQDVNRLVLPTQNPSSSMSLPQVVDNSTARPSSVSASTSDQTNVVRQSKKRSRASRRAPTTVLTTDTSNFRAMVQEFTGIPAPPFSSSPFPRSRFDLFNSSSTMRVGHLEPNRPPPYLLRPFAQKAAQPPPFAASLTPGSATNTTSNANNMNTSNSNSSTNYQLLSELGLSKQSQNHVNMQNPLLTFQSLLQSTINNPQKFQLPNSSSFGENSQQGISSSNTRMGGLEEFNVNHGQARNSHLNELQNFVTSDGTTLLRNDNIASNNTDGVESNNGSNQGQLQSFNENYGNNSSQRVNNNCKMNYTAGSSSHDKGSDQNNVVTSRGGEGMMDSWICSSD